jgi:hypothetical protein
LPLLSEVPHRFHSFALEHNRIATTWENCLAFLSSESFNAERLTAYLADAATMKILSKNAIPSRKEALPLSQFLLNNDGLGEGAYRSYVAIMPWKFNNFPPKINLEKLKILVEEDRISFTATSFESLSKQPEIQVLFATKNIDTFLGGSNDYKVDDDFRMELLRSSISDDEKRIVIRDMDPDSISTDALSAAVVGPILDRTSLEPVQLGFDMVRSLIVNSRPIEVQVSLLNKSQETLSEDQVRGILAEFEEPYSDIAAYGKSPTIQNTSENRSMTEWLDRRQIISSWKPTPTEKDLRIHTFKTNSGNVDE